MSLARIEQQAEQQGGVTMERVFINTILTEAVQVCRGAAEKRSIQLLPSCSNGISVEANMHLLQQAVVNLIDNAVKYSDEESRVFVTGVSDGDLAVISIRDEGCGIDEEHLPRIFERFYRVDKARSRKLGGTGLGLAIVKHIAQVHGGTVAAESAPGEGSTFSIRIPKG